MSEAPYLTREAAAKSALFTIEAGGMRIDCRIPSTMEFLASGVMPWPTIPPEATPEERDRLLGRAKIEMQRDFLTVMETSNVALSLVMVRPRFWIGDEDKCPPGAITPGLFGPYRDEAVMKILPFLGYEESRRQAVEFRHPDEEGTPADAAGEDHGAGSARTA